MADTDDIGLEMDGDWHLIQSKADLIAVRDAINVLESANSDYTSDDDPGPDTCVFYKYRLTTDITFNSNDVPWESIIRFRGIFDGDGYTISNLILAPSSGASISYGFLSNNHGIIENLNLVDVSLSPVPVAYLDAAYPPGHNYPSQDYSYLFVGFLVSENFEHGEIYNCHVKGDMTFNAIDSDEYILIAIAFTGGVVGASMGTTSDCSFTGNLIFPQIDSSFYQYIGGFAGMSGELSNCNFIGTIDLSSPSYVEFIGGISGVSGRLSDSFTECTINIVGSEVRHVGGLSGMTPHLSNCFTNSEIHLTANDINHVGGLAGVVQIVPESSLSGFNFLNNIENSYAAGDIVINAKNVEFVGGLVGATLYYLDNFDDLSGTACIKNCYVTGDVFINPINSAGNNNPFSFKNIGGLVGGMSDFYGLFAMASGLGYSLEQSATVVNSYALNEEIRVPLSIEGSSIAFRSVYPIAPPELLSPSSFYWENMTADLNPIGYVPGGALVSQGASQGLTNVDSSQFIGISVPSSDIWNKIDWIGTGDWKLHTYHEFKLPIFIWQDSSFMAEAIHLLYGESGGNPSGKGVVPSGQSEGKAVINPNTEGSIYVGAKNETVPIPSVPYMPPQPPVVILSSIFVAIAAFVFRINYLKEE